MAECLTSQFRSPGAYYAASSYAEKPSALSKPGQPTVLSETRGSIAFSGCPRGNIVYTRFSAALSGTTFCRETHPRRSTAKAMLHPQAPGTDTTRAGEDAVRSNERSLRLCRFLQFLLIVLLSPLPQRKNYGCELPSYIHSSDLG